MDLVTEKHQHPDEPQNHAYELAARHRFAQDPHAEQHAPDRKRMGENRRGGTWGLGLTILPCMRNNGTDLFKNKELDVCVY